MARKKKIHMYKEVDLRSICIIARFSRQCSQICFAEQVKKKFLLSRAHIYRIPSSLLRIWTEGVNWGYAIQPQGNEQLQKKQVEERHQSTTLPFSQVCCYCNNKRWSLLVRWTIQEDIKIFFFVSFLVANRSVEVEREGGKFSFSATKISYSVYRILLIDIIVQVTRSSRSFLYASPSSGIGVSGS